MSTDRVVYIYTLVDPITHEVRYVGKTVNLSKRMYQHTYLKCATHTSKWIKSLSEFPQVVIVDEVTNDWEEAEKFWISYFKFMGANLTNLKSGGDSPHGWKHSEETKAKIKASNVGKMHSEKTIARLRTLRTGMTSSKETCLRISAALTGIPKSKEHAQKVGDTHRGKKHSSDSIAKMVAAHKNRKPVEESTREKIRQLHTGRKDKPESHAKAWETRRLNGWTASEETRAKMSESAKQRHKIKK